MTDSFRIPNLPTEEELQRPATLAQKLEMATKSTPVVGDTLRPSDYPDGEAYATAGWEAVKQAFARAREMRRDPDGEHYPAV